MDSKDRKKNLPLPPMTALPVFEAVGQYLSVARAAEALNLTPGAISRQIQNLELYLGIALFVRNHRRMSFTPEGEEYWAQVKRLYLISAMRRAPWRSAPKMPP